jgi:hypothetical protein
MLSGAVDAENTTREVEDGPAYEGNVSRKEFRSVEAHEQLPVSSTDARADATVRVGPFSMWSTAGMCRSRPRERHRTVHAVIAVIGCSNRSNWLTPTELAECVAGTDLLNVWLAPTC